MQRPLPRSLALLPLLVLATLLLPLSARAQDDGGVRYYDKFPFPKNLSDWRLFVRDGATLSLNSGVRPYDLVNPLFSDYATKFRTMWLPPGKAATYNQDGSLDYPEGTIFTKTFAYADKALDVTGATVDIHDPRYQLAFAGAMQTLQGQHLIETRLFVHTTKGWMGLPYVWNDTQTEATLQLTGSQRDLTWNGGADGASLAIHYVVPNFNQCKGCHIYLDGFDHTTVPIGPKRAHNLNRDVTYPDGHGNQLAGWAQRGLLTGLPPVEDVPRLPVWNDPTTGSLGDRARAYLEVNCAHCHNPHGPAGTSGLTLTFDETTPVQFGVCKAPVAAGPGSGGLAFDVVPGHPEQSIMIYRMSSTDVAAMMPALGRSVVHREGVDLIKAWVASLQGDCGAAGAWTKPGGG